MALPDETIIRLRNIQAVQERIEQLLKAQMKPDGGTFRDKVGAWSHQQKGKTHFYEQLVTFAGSTISVYLDLSYISQLNRTEQIFSDTTARDYEVRTYTENSATAYAIEASGTGDVSSKIIDIGGMEYKHPAGTRFEFYYANFTVDKTVRIRLQVDEI